MKIKIAYQAHEEKKAKEIEEWLKWRMSIIGTPKVVKSDRHAPYFHTYLSVDYNGKPHK